VAALIVNLLALRKGLPAELRPTRGQYAVLCISPLSLMRSFDFVEPELVGGFEPALVACLTVDAKVAQRFLQDERRRLKHPLTLKSLDPAQADWLDADAALRAHVMERLDALAKHRGLQAEAPAPKVRHCPRCLSEYGGAAQVGECTACPGVALAGG